MESSCKLLGYKCEFIDSVPDDFYCKGCSFVARRLTFTSCCGESYCHACVSNTQQEAKPCPACGEESFSIYEQIKYQKRMGNLQVYCSMKERGCEWSGTLDQLDSHLDPDQDDCQYIDTSCPLNCLTVLAKNKMEEHVSKMCFKRDYTCQFCAFKATYEYVINTHLPECKYVPLKCPNRCGVSCEREVMVDHLKICRLQVVECQFKGMGCEAKFKREEEEEHAVENVQKHLSLIAKSGVQNVELLERLKKQEQKFEEQEEQLCQLQKTICEQEQKLKQQELQIQWQEQVTNEIKMKSQPQGSDGTVQKLFVEQLQFLREELRQKELFISAMKEFVLKRSFFMKEFTKEKEKDRSSEWKSPAMYTHLFGYKFCIGIDPNGNGISHGKALTVELWPMKGEYDYRLKWPADATFNIEIINQHGGPNWIGSSRISWSRPEQGDYHNFDNVKCRSEYVFIFHSKLKNYLSEEDTLFFHITDITLH